LTAVTTSGLGSTLGVDKPQVGYLVRPRADEPSGQRHGLWISFGKSANVVPGEFLNVRPRTDRDRRAASADSLRLDDDDDAVDRHAPSFGSPANQLKRRANAAATLRYAG
jgi:hypothetical protein